jgi:hypothetical protein
MTTVLEGGEGSGSRPGRSLTRERPNTHCTGGWVGPRVGLDRCVKSCPPLGFDPQTVQPVASRYTDYATRPTRIWVSSTKRFGNSIHDYKKLPIMWTRWWVAKTGNDRKYDIRIIVDVDEKKWWSIRICYFLSFVIQTANSWTPVEGHEIKGGSGYSQVHVVAIKNMHKFDTEFNF